MMKCKKFTKAITLKCDRFNKISKFFTKMDVEYGRT